MGVIVDTSIWVNVERKQISHVDVADAIENDDVYLAPPIIAELEYGVSRAKTAAQRNKRLSAIAKIKKKPCLIIDKYTGELFGVLAAELDAMGKPAKYRIQDLWIAALAIQHNYKVLTQNEKDFLDIPGLDVIVLKK